jgi:outer membrane murein-binding lipoprotein Lpp
LIIRRLAYFRALFSNPKKHIIMAITGQQKEKNETPKTATNGKANTPPAKETPATASTPQLEQELKVAREMAKTATEEASKSQKEADNAKMLLEKSKPLNVADAMARIYTAKEVLARLEFLRDTKKSLSDFTLGRSGMKDEVKLTDGTGHVFQTTNTDTVKIVLETLRAELDGKIASTEKELMGMV